ncbi:hypothetical protein BDZ89DRAFT_197846 [Hymenopellis radicata]|nr:hypothetical protein BDZ89DRAFT_197846 [Hymenopellis radicata]
MAHLVHKVVALPAPAMSRHQALPLSPVSPLVPWSATLEEGIWTYDGGHHCPQYSPHRQGDHPRDRLNAGVALGPAVDDESRATRTRSDVRIRCTTRPRTVMELSSTMLGFNGS